MPSTRLIAFEWALFLVACAAFTIPAFSHINLYDDAFMFWRYADRFAGGLGMSWNTQTGPIYGPSSVLYVFVVQLAHRFTDNPALGLILASFGTGALAMLLLVAILRLGASDGMKVLWLVAAMSGLLSTFSAQLSSGMDTMLGLAAMSAYVLLVHRAYHGASRVTAFAAGVCGGALWLVRPEMTIVAVLTPIAIAVLTRDRSGKQVAGAMLLGTAFGIGVALLLCALLFGSVVPLAFYIKSTGFYDQWFHHKYQLKALRNAGVFVLRLLPVWVIVVLWLRRGAPRSVSPPVIALAVAAIVVFLYLTFGVTQIMGENRRFYVPLIPLVLYGAVMLLNDRALTVGGPRLQRALIAAAFLWTCANAAHGAYLIALGKWRPYVGHFAPLQMYEEGYKTYWPKLDELSRLPDGVSFAGTEIGLPAVLSTRRTVTDLSGLNEPIIARERKKVSEVIQSFQPDLIWLPHPDYRTMNADLRSNAWFRLHYHVFEAESLGCELGLAIRKGSSHEQEMLRIVGG